MSADSGGLRYLSVFDLPVPALAPVPKPRLNHLGVRHGGRYPAGFFTIGEAVRRALWKADQTGIRHRVTICRASDDAHYLPGVWANLHFVVEPVDGARHV